MQHYIASLTRLFTQSIHFYKGTHISRDALHANWYDLYVAIAAMAWLSVLSLFVNTTEGYVVNWVFATIVATLLSWWVAVKMGLRILNKNKHEHHATARELTQTFVVTGLLFSATMFVLDLLFVVFTTSSTSPSGLYVITIGLFTIYMLVREITWISKLFGVSRDRAAYAVFVPGIVALLLSGLVYAVVVGSSTPVM